MDAADAVMAAMKQCACKVDVVRKGCQLLAEVAFQPHCCPELAKGGVGSALVAALGADVSDGDVALAACTALARLAQHAECVPTLVNAGAVKVVRLALQAHINVADIMGIACSTLRRLAAGGDPVNFSVGAAHLILAALDAHRDNLDCVCDALGALAALTAVEPLPERVRTTSVVTALRRHGYEAGVAYVGCNIIVNLPLHRRTLVDDGAGPVIASVLHAHAREAPIVAAGCSALARLAALPENKAVFIRERAWEAVAAVLPPCVNDLAAVRAACGALRSLAASDGPACAGMADAVGAGVIEALRRHTGGARDVVIAACDVLALLATTPECCVALCAGGVVGAVVGALGAHSTDAGVAAAACLLISALSVARDARQPLVEGGAGAAVMAALATHADVVEVVQPACCVLRSLGNAVAAPACGAAMVAALKTHAHDVAAVAAACGVLSRLSAVEANCLPLVTVGACAAVRSVLSRHSRNRAVARAACTTLRNIIAAADAALPPGSAEGAALPSIIGDGTVSALAAALQVHTGDVVVVRASLSALRLLAAADGSLAALWSGGGDKGDAALDAMGTHIADPDVALAGCELLHHLAGITTLQPRLCNAGAAEVLAAALCKHGGSVEVVHTAIAALSQLTAYEANLPFLVAARLAVETARATHPTDMHIQRYGHNFIEALPRHLPGAPGYDGAAAAAAAAASSSVSQSWD